MTSRGRSKPPCATLEHGHRMLPQYYGINSTIADPRPNPRTRRGVSPEDEEARAAFVDEVAARYRKERE